jgi:hypothetical protein
MPDFRNPLSNLLMSVGGLGVQGLKKLQPFKRTFRAWAQPLKPTFHPRSEPCRQTFYAFFSNLETLEQRTGRPEFESLKTG